jgi:NAD(P)H-dependent flavin oxidoreductase YrpB (nitropropane dioxygenase family)
LRECGRPGRVNLSLGAAQKAGADLRGAGTKDQRRRNPAGVCNTACRDDRYTHGIDDGGQQSEQAHLLPLGRGRIETTAMPAGVRALRDDHIGASSLDFSAQCEAMLAAGPPIISSVMGLYPPEFVARLKAKGIVWFANISTVSEARAAEPRRVRSARPPCSRAR